MRRYGLTERKATLNKVYHWICPKQTHDGCELQDFKDFKVPW